MSSKRQKRCYDPSQGAPIVWVKQGKAQHMAYLLKDAGDHKYVRWASNLANEWVESSTVESQVEGRASRRRGNVNYNTSSTTPTSANSTEPSRPKRGGSRASQKVDYKSQTAEEEDEEEFEWDNDAAPQDDDEEDGASSTRVPRKRSTKGNRKERNKKEVASKKKEAPDLDDSSLLSSDRSFKKKKKKKRRREEEEEEKPAEEIRLEEKEQVKTEDAAMRKSKRPRVTIQEEAAKPADPPADEAIQTPVKAAPLEANKAAAPPPEPVRTPNRNTKDYPVNTDSIMTGAPVAKRTKKRGWISGIVTAVNGSICYVRWTCTGKVDQLEKKDMAKMIYDADTSKHPVGSKVKKEFTDGESYSGRVVSIDNSLYKIEYKNPPCFQILGLSELDQIIKLKNNKQPVASAASAPGAKLDSPGSAARDKIQTPGESTAAEVKKNKKRDPSASPALAHKDIFGVEHKKSPSPTKTKPETTTTTSTDPPEAKPDAPSAESKLGDNDAAASRKKSESDVASADKNDSVAGKKKTEVDESKPLAIKTPSNVEEAGKATSRAFSPMDATAQIRTVASRLQQNAGVVLPPAKSTSLADAAGESCKKKDTSGKEPGQSALTAATKTTTDDSKSADAPTQPEPAATKKGEKDSTVLPEPVKADNKADTQKTDAPEKLANVLSPTKPKAKAVSGAKQDNLPQPEKSNGNKDVKVDKAAAENKSTSNRDSSTQPHEKKEIKHVQTMKSAATPATEKSLAVRVSSKTETKTDAGASKEGKSKAIPDAGSKLSETQQASNVKAVADAGSTRKALPNVADSSAGVDGKDTKKEQKVGSGPEREQADTRAAGAAPHVGANNSELERSAGTGKSSLQIKATAKRPGMASATVQAGVSGKSNPPTSSLPASMKSVKESPLPGKVIAAVVHAGVSGKSDRPSSSLPSSTKSVNASAPPGKDNAGVHAVVSGKSHQLSSSLPSSTKSVNAPSLPGKGTSGVHAGVSDKIVQPSSSLPSSTKSVNESTLPGKVNAESTAGVSGKSDQHAGIAGKSYPTSSLPYSTKSVNESGLPGKVNVGVHAVSGKSDRPSPSFLSSTKPVNASALPVKVNQGATTLEAQKGAQTMSKLSKEPKATVAPLVSTVKTQQPALTSNQTAALFEKVKSGAPSVPKVTRPSKGRSTSEGKAGPNIKTSSGFPVKESEAASKKRKLVKSHSTPTSPSTAPKKRKLLEGDAKRKKAKSETAKNKAISALPVKGNSDVSAAASSHANEAPGTSKVALVADKSKATQPSGGAAAKPGNAAQAKRTIYSVLAGKPNPGMTQGKPTISSLLAGVPSSSMESEGKRTISSVLAGAPTTANEVQGKRSIVSVLLSRPPDRKKQVAPLPIGKGKGKAEMPADKNASTPVPPAAQTRSESVKATAPSTTANTKPSETSKLGAKLPENAGSGATNPTIASQAAPVPTAIQQSVAAAQGVSQSRQAYATTGSMAMQQNAWAMRNRSNLTQNQVQSGTNGAGTSSQAQGGVSSSQPTDYSIRQRLALENLIRQQNPSLYYALAQPNLASSISRGNMQQAFAANYGALMGNMQQARAPAAPTQVSSTASLAAYISQNRPRQAGQMDPPGVSPQTKRPG
ncbi:expressed unknown protein [Seminavis robusta]|uniref:Uncharacterized protein n=1 Tax=Seminavis robusta TaxID=568900 RepID=A0A9N8DC68_9STRA|nr:expressed unknown protein [Seminavis robusta]|eukprot:Sro73_g040470.1 n/a (1605) ;mRNA; r:96765-101769